MAFAAVPLRQGVGKDGEGKPVATGRSSYSWCRFEGNNVTLWGGTHIERWANSLKVGIDNDLPHQIIRGWCACVRACDY